MKDNINNLISKSSINHLTEDIGCLLLHQNSKEKNELILRGIEKELDVSWYANPKFNVYQMYEIYLGLKEGLDVSWYANPKLNEIDMAIIRYLLANKLDKLGDGLDFGLKLIKYLKLFNFDYKQRNITFDVITKRIFLIIENYHLFKLFKFDIIKYFILNLAFDTIELITRLSKNNKKFLLFKKFIDSIPINQFEKLPIDTDIIINKIVNFILVQNENIIEKISVVIDVFIKIINKIIPGNNISNKTEMLHRFSDFVFQLINFRNYYKYNFIIDNFFRYINDNNIDIEILEFGNKKFGDKQSVFDILSLIGEHKIPINYLKTLIKIHQSKLIPINPNKF